MKIRRSVVEAVIRAWLGQDCTGFLKPTHVMATSPKWSTL